MIALTPGKALTPGDLYLLTRDCNGNPVVPAYIAYTIFSVSGGVSALASAPRVVPANPETGYYYVSMTIPPSWAEGTYQIVWYLKLLDTDAESTTTEDFTITPTKVGVNLQAPSMLMASTPAVTQKYADIVVQVRELLSDTNPDRNYHFRPPTAAKTVANFNSRVGFIWEDVSILRMLKIAISRINSANPKTMYNFTLDTLQPPFTECAVLGAAYLCLTAEGCRWTADEFGYSLNGVSLDLQKGQNYLSLATQYKTAFDEWLPVLTEVRPTSAGLRQYRWLR